MNVVRWSGGVICTCGFISFLVYAVHRTSIIACIVFCRGTGFTCYVNVYANSIMVTGLTAVAGKFFITNSRTHSGSGVLKAILHVVFVQCLLLLALCIAGLFIIN